MDAIGALILAPHEVGFRTLDGALAAIDQEPSIIQRLTGGPQASAMALGKIAQEDLDTALALTKRHGELTGALIKRKGFGMDLAPVVDSRFKPFMNNRLFGDHPQTVGQLGAAFVEGLNTAGVAGCLKHFPEAAGDTREDPHQKTPVLKGSPTTFRTSSRYLPGLEWGLSALMVGHTVCPDFDELPASISPKWIERIIRGKMAFDGVVVSDSLDMGALGSYAKDEDEAAVKAIAAGCDLIIVSEAGRATAEKSLTDAMNTGAISRQRIEQSFQRRQKFLDSIAKLPTLPYSEKEIADLSRELDEDITDRSIESVSIKIPFDRPVALLMPEGIPEFPLEAEVRKVNPKITTVSIPIHPTPTDIQNVLKKISGAAHAVCVTWNRKVYNQEIYDQSDLVRAMAAKIPTTLISTMSPEPHLHAVVKQAIATYGITAATAAALGRRLVSI